MRLIDADVPKEKLQADHDFYINAWGGFKNLPANDKARVDELTAAIAAVVNAPTIDAVPVVHGRWVKANGMMPPEYHHRRCCSVCGGWALYDHIGREWTSKYCPNCGAKMDAEEPINE